MPTREMHIAAGRSARDVIPRDTLAQLTTSGRDPLGILDRQNADRLPELLPVRAERMAQSPFAFYRGTAAIMAADLARDPHTGIQVGSCGDAHVANFGFYAGPQRTLVFDLNDFDEAGWAPWEWDLKRLVTSIVIAGRAAGHEDAVVRAAVRCSATSSTSPPMRESRRSTTSPAPCWRRPGATPRGTPPSARPASSPSAATTACSGSSSDRRP